MSSGRIFKVALNVDDFSAALDLCEGVQERLQFLDGLRSGLRGMEAREGWSEAKRNGCAVALAGYRHAVSLVEKQRAKAIKGWKDRRATTTPEHMPRHTPEHMPRHTPEHMPSIKPLIHKPRIEEEESAAATASTQSTLGQEQCQEATQAPVIEPSLNGHGVVTENESPAGSPFATMYHQIRSCRPEFSRIRECDLVAAFGGVDYGVAASAVSDFIRDMATQLECPRNPVKLLRGYIGQAASKAATSTASPMTAGRRWTQKARRFTQDAVGGAA